MADLAVGDEHAAQLASLLEIDVGTAGAALEKADGDFSRAIDIISGSVSSPVGAERVEGAPRGWRVEWPDGGESMLSPEFEHQVTLEPRLLPRISCADGCAVPELVLLASKVPLTADLASDMRELTKATGLPTPGPVSSNGIAELAPLITALSTGGRRERIPTVVSLSAISLNPPSAPPTPCMDPGPAREAEILENKARLQERLRECGLRQIEVLDDGNCLFRACSAQLYHGDAAGEYHGLVRHRAAAEIHSRADMYEPLFGSRDTFLDYLTKMATPPTWGDELVLRAIADAYDVVVHVITSNEDNWYLVYGPEEPDSPRYSRHIFLAYVFPVHYSGFEAKPLDPSDVTVSVRK